MTTIVPAAAGQSPLDAFVLKSKTLQNAATGDGNGTDFDITGMATVVVTINPTSYTGTVTFKASEDGTNFDNILGTKLGTTTVASSVANPGSTKSIWVFETAGLQKFRAALSSSGGTSITVTAHASPYPNAVPVGSTIGTAVIQANSGTALAADQTNSELRVSNYVKTTTAGDTALTLGQTTMAASLPVTVASDQSDVGVVNHAGATGGATPYHLSSANTNNATNVKASAGNLYGYAIHNTTASTVEFVKFYNKATAPAPGTDNALLTWIVRIPGASQVIGTFDTPIAFSSGIGFATVTGASDTDNTAVGAGDLIINLIYK